MSQGKDAHLLPKSAGLALAGHVATLATGRSACVE